MSKSISTRLNENEIQRLNMIAEEEHLDKASLIRKFILNEIELYNMKKMGELYRKGIVSLQEAAHQANVSLYKMMDYVEKEKLHPPEQNDEEINEDIARADAVFESIKSKTKNRKR